MNTRLVLPVIPLMIALNCMPACGQFNDDGPTAASLMASFSNATMNVPLGSTGRSHIYRAIADATVPVEIVLNAADLFPSTWASQNIFPKMVAFSEAPATELLRGGLTDQANLMNAEIRVEVSFTASAQGLTVGEAGGGVASQAAARTSVFQNIAGDVFGRRLSYGVRGPMGVEFSNPWASEGIDIDTLGFSETDSYPIYFTLDLVTINWLMSPASISYATSDIRVAASTSTIYTIAEHGGSIEVAYSRVQLGLDQNDVIDALQIGLGDSLTPQIIVFSLTPESPSLAALDAQWTAPTSSYVTYIGAAHNTVNLATGLPYSAGPTAGSLNSGATLWAIAPLAQGQSYPPPVAPYVRGIGGPPYPWAPPASLGARTTDDVDGARAADPIREAHWRGTRHPQVLALGGIEYGGLSGAIQVEELGSVGSVIAGAGGPMRKVTVQANEVFQVSFAAVGNANIAWTLHAGTSFLLPQENTATYFYNSPAGPLPTCFDFVATTSFVLASSSITPGSTWNWVAALPPGISDFALQARVVDSINGAPHHYTTNGVVIHVE